VTTTATHAGFIPDICEHPDDDSIRLIYADYLEDHGDPERAEFIRVQVEVNGPRQEWDAIQRQGCWTCHNRQVLLKRMAGGQTMPSPCKRCSDLECYVYSREAKERSYLEANAYELGEECIPGEPGWHVAGPGELIAVNGITLLFRRGFIAEIHAPLAVLEKHLTALVRQHPIERVRVTDKEPKHYQAIPFYREHWSWWGNDMPDKEDIPMELFQLLSGDDPSLSNQLYPDCKNFPTAEAAHAALSEALLRLARGMV